MQHTSLTSDKLTEQFDTLWNAMQELQTLKNSPFLAHPVCMYVRKVNFCVL